MLGVPMKGKIKADERQAESFPEISTGLSLNGSNGFRFDERLT